MGKKVDIFGIRFDNLTTEQIAKRMLDSISADVEKPLIVFTPNPEIVMSAQKNKKLFTAMQIADIICADGIGIVWASKYFGERIRTRATGYDVVQALFRLGVEGGGITAFFFGGSEDSVTKAAKKMSEKYKGLNISGTRNGYIAEGSFEVDALIKEINESNAAVLLVGLGSPKQELWVMENASKLKVRVIMVVGGSFDVMSGNLKRAPKILRRVGLEWLYRLIKQPKRIFRMIKLPLFVIKVLFRRGIMKSKTQ